MTPVRSIGAPTALLLLAATLLVGPAPPARAAGGPLAPPEPAVLDEAKVLVQHMRQAERGPFQRLRWYCKDGTVHPPQPYPCGGRGGGWQHAERSDRAFRLSELGWDVGTIYTGMPWEELSAGGERRPRLQQLPLERYLIDIDNGWVLNKARYYRGWVQIEDEEEAGAGLLARLLSDPAWVRAHFLLARESTRTIPHRSGSDRTRNVRRLAKELAETDPSFERIRLKIHTTPGRDDATATRDWLKAARAANRSREILARAEQLATELDNLYGETARAERLARAGRTLGQSEAGSRIAPLLAPIAGEQAADRARRFATAMRLVRETVETSADGTANLRLLDLSRDAEAELRLAAFELLGDGRTSRTSLLDLALTLLDGAYGAGLLTATERESVAGPIARLREAPEAPTAAYLAAVQRLSRAGGWTMAAIRYAFADALSRYTALDRRAARFPDDLLRESAALPLGELSTILALDSDGLGSQVHLLFGQELPGVMGLNPGVAVGRLRLVSATEALDPASLKRDEIVVLPESVPELPPVAGMLTLGERNVVSHVQLLARNLGVPSACVTPQAVAALGQHAGREVVLAVAADGALAVAEPGRLPAELLAAVRAPQSPVQEGLERKLTAPPPDLAVSRPLPIAELNASLSGKVVGPKAANVGELRRKFPGRVAPAVALPFGLFAAHAAHGPGSPKERLDRAFARHRQGELSDGELMVEVEQVRQAVLKLSLSPETRAQLEPILLDQFGPPGSYGVFVRSDTNVEDLPGFTGAGLNKTVPNVVGLKAQLEAVPQVWASPFTARAMGWRMKALANPEEVYPSVLLMKSVPNDKSGVLVTRDLEGGGAGLTVAMSWGVGGAVEGEVSEVLLLRPDGSDEILSEAKSPYRRALKPTGGVEWLPAASGPVLTPAERLAIRAFAAEATERLTPSLDPAGTPLPWDIELGFVGGDLQLLQVRPLVEKGRQIADRVVQALGVQARPMAPVVRLGEPPLGRSAEGSPPTARPAGTRP